VARRRREATEEVLAAIDFPPEHGRGSHTTNVRERPKRERARRCAVVGLFPTVAAVRRLLAAPPGEGLGQWRHIRQASMANHRP